MKKVILVFVVCILSLNMVKAQIAKGNIFVGTSVGSTAYNFGTSAYNYSNGNVKTQDQNEYTLSFSPTMGVFVTNHLILGGNLNLAYSNNTVNYNNTTASTVKSNSTTITNTVSVGPFFRYYFYDGKPTRSLLFFQGNAAIGTGGGSTTGYTLNSNTSTSNSSGTTTGLFNYKLGAAIGVTQFIQSNIGFDLSVGYAYNYESYTNSVNTQTISSTGVPGSSTTTIDAIIPQNGITLSAGFHFYLRKNKKK